MAAHLPPNRDKHLSLLIPDETGTRFINPREDKRLNWPEDCERIPCSRKLRAEKIWKMA